jgi:hypothetical protein
VAAFQARSCARRFPPLSSKIDEGWHRGKRILKRCEALKGAIVVGLVTPSPVILRHSDLTRAPRFRRLADKSSPTSMAGETDSKSEPSAEYNCAPNSHRRPAKESKSALLADVRTRKPDDESLPYRVAFDQLLPTTHRRTKEGNAAKDPR